MIPFYKLYLLINSIKLSLYGANKNLMQHTGHGPADRLKHNRIQIMVPVLCENQEKN